MLLLKTVAVMATKMYIFGLGKSTFYSENYLPRKTMNNRYLEFYPAAVQR